jgi:hypothetical protein
MNASARIAIDYLNSNGERTATRLRELCKHFAGIYGEDEGDTVKIAMDAAKRLVIGFRENA